MRKFITSIIALVLMSVSVMAVNFSAGGVYYSTLSENTVQVVAPTEGKYTGAVVIPQQVIYNAVVYTVTAIGEQAFQGATKLTSVTLPMKGITSIGPYAFNDCTGLTEFTLPASITSIGERAFFYCDKLHDLYVHATDPASYHAGNLAFARIHYGSNVCTLHVPVGCKAVYTANAAFKDFTQMAEITSGICGDELTWSFDAGTNTLTIDGTGAMDNYSAGNAAPWSGAASTIKQVILPDGMTSIGDYAFSGCSSLTSVVIPEGVATIGTYAFNGCTALKAITNHAPSVQKTGENAFNDVNRAACKLNVRGKALDSFKAAEQWKDFDIAAYSFVVTFVDWNGIELKQEEVPSGNPATAPNDPSRPAYKFTGWDKDFSNVKTNLTVTAQYEMIVSGICGKDGKGNLADNLTWTFDPKTNTLTIEGKGAMYDYSGLEHAPWAGLSPMITQVVLPDGLSTIGNSAFEMCSSLPALSIPESVTAIGSNAFFDCSMLMMMALPESVVSIGDGAFSSCTMLSSVTIPNKVTSIGSEAFYNCAALTSVTLSESISEIKQGTFRGCTALGSIKLPKNLETIEDEAFSGCVSLTSVSIPENVTSIGYGVFLGCSSLATVKMNNDLASMDDKGYQFSHIAINSLSLPANAKFTTIPEGAFEYCQKLTTMTIPANVADIAGNAFYSCSGLKEIHNLALAPQKLGSDVFYDVDRANCKLYINIKAEEAFKTADVWKDFDIVAKFYTVTFVDWDGNILKSEAVSPETAATAPKDPERFSYTFTGWDKDFSNVTDNMTVTAQYEMITSGICGKDGEGNLADNLTWTFDPKSGTLTIEGEGAMMDYYRAPWYGFSHEILQVSLPEGLTTIGKNAFKSSGIALIDIPNSVTHINANAFWSCKSLTSVVIPEGVTIIKSMTFLECYALTSIVIPEGVTSIEFEAFMRCKSLTSIVIPGSVISIDDWAFCECESLTSVVISNGVTSIGKGTFSGCTALTSIEIPKSVTSIGEFAFQNCKSLTSVVIPEGIKSLKKGTFNFCSSLTSVVIPKSCTSLGDYVFETCSALKEITNYAVTPQELGEDAFKSADRANCKLYVNIKAEEAYKAAEVWKDFDIVANFFTVTFVDWDGYVLKSEMVSPGFAATAPTGLERNSYTFAGWDKDFSNVTDNMTVTAQYELITSGICGMDGEGNLADNLTWTFDPKSGTLTIEGEGAMMDFAPSDAPWYGFVHEILQVSLPKGLTTIGNRAFYDCSALTSVDIPNSVTSIGKWSFINCKSLTSVVIPEGVTIIREATFVNCYALTSVVIPEGVTSIEFEAFMDCKSLTSIVIPSSVISIDDWAFVYCESLSSVVIPEGVISIGEGAFSGTAMTSIEIPNSVTSIGAFAFQDCSLTSVVIPGGVTSLEKGTFNLCSSLTSVVIPASCTSIGEHAFWGCSALKEITNYALSPQVLLDEYVFQDVDRANCKLYVNIKAEEAYKAADVWKDFDIVANFYTVTFVDWYGKVLKNEAVSPGFAATAPEVWERTSYTFTGWDKDFSNVTDNMTVTAQYEMITSGICGMDGEGNLADNLTWTFDPKSGTLTIEGEGAMMDYKVFSPWRGYSDQILQLLLPQGLTTIGMQAFSDCSALTSVVIPEGVISIGVWAFYECTSLSSVVIPEGVISIGEMAFELCTSLSSVVIPDGVTSIEYGVFSTTALTSIEIPNSVTSLGGYAFHDCSSLTSVVIPESCTSIEYSAFEGCSALKAITNYALTPQELGYNAFNGVDRPACKLYVNTSAEEAYKAADVWKEFDIEAKDIATGTDDVQGNQEQSTKYIKDGQLFILRGGKVFNALGNCVSR